MRTLLLAILLSPFCTNAQYYEQYFEGTSFYPLPYNIDTSQANNLWQVGPPQKTLFTSALSIPNVIVTDTTAPYPLNNTSSFTIKAPLYDFGYPVFFLRFYQAFDTDSVNDGGYVEVSWDNGDTWINLFEDWLMPLNIELYNINTSQSIEADTLANGQIGFSGASGYPNNTADWIYSAFCWENIGAPLADSIFVRFTFESDSIADHGDGWMIDNITIESYISHPVIDYTRMDDYLKVAPTLIEDRVQVIYDVDDEITPVFLALYDGQGRMVRSLRNAEMPRGVDHITVWRSDLPSASGPLFLRGHIGNREVHEKLMLMRDQNH